jgi:hypothetical protein
MSLEMAQGGGWRMSAIPPLLEGKQTLGELPENDAHDPKRRLTTRFDRPFRFARD